MASYLLSRASRDALACLPTAPLFHLGAKPPIAPPAAGWWTPPPPLPIRTPLGAGDAIAVHFTQRLRTKREGRFPCLFGYRTPPVSKHRTATATTTTTYSARSERRDLIAASSRPAVSFARFSTSWSKSSNSALDHNRIDHHGVVPAVELINELAPFFFGHGFVPVGKHECLNSGRLALITARLHGGKPIT